ncbi:MAG: hypothetical protein ACLR17_21420 [Enterobacteriaceae bacterium]
MPTNVFSGAAITAWAQQYRDHHASLWFIDEEINSDSAHCPGDCRVNLAGVVANQWQIW